jgi:hypothetical protein
LKACSPRIGSVAGSGYEGGFLGDLRKAGLVISFKPDHERSVPELENELRKGNWPTCPAYAQQPRERGSRQVV